MEVYIIGCGGNSKVVADICELNGYQIMGFFDDKYDGQNIPVYHKYQVIGKIDDIGKYPNIKIINSIGDCTIRKKIYQKLSGFMLEWINCIHPKASIVPTAHMGKGNIVCYGAFINSDAILGDFNLINTYAIIEHDCHIGDFNHIAPRVTLCGGIVIGNDNLLGTGTSVIPCKKIGNNNIIGAMTVVIRDLSNNSKIVGIPGRKIN